MVQVLIGAFLISFSSVFVKLVHVGPTSAMFYRFFFGAITLIVLVLLKKDPFFKAFHTLKYSIAGGIIFAVDLSLWHRSIHYIGPGLATILANFQVFSLAIIGALYLNETLTRKFVIAVSLAFTGLFLIVGWQFDQMEALYKMGVVYGLLTAVCFTGLTLVLQKSQKIPNKLSPTANMMWVCIFGSLLGSIFVMLSGETFVIPDAQNLVLLFAYGSICTAAGWVFITKGLPDVSASLAGLALILQPTGAFTWDLLFFARPTTSLQMTGAILTICAIYLGALRNDKS